MSDPLRTEGEPHDRLTRLCAAMTDTLDAHPERGEEKCVIFLQDGERGGLVIHGYDNDLEAMADLFVHLRAIFTADGKTLMFAPISKG
jgi:hypothetical protein